MGVDIWISRHSADIKILRKLNQKMFAIVFFFQKAIICFDKTIVSVSKEKSNVGWLKMHSSCSGQEIQAVGLKLRF